MGSFPRALSRPTYRTPKPCWRSWRDKWLCTPHRSDTTPNCASAHLPHHQAPRAQRLVHMTTTPARGVWPVRAHTSGSVNIAPMDFMSVLCSRERPSAYVRRDAGVMPSGARGACPVAQRIRRTVQAPLPGLYCPSTTRSTVERSHMLCRLGQHTRAIGCYEQPHPFDDGSRRTLPVRLTVRSCRISQAWTTRWRGPKAWSVWRRRATWPDASERALPRAPGGGWRRPALRPSSGTPPVPLGRCAPPSTLGTRRRGLRASMRYPTPVARVAARAAAARVGHGSYAPQ